jgi:fructokinase
MVRLAAVEGGGTTWVVAIAEGTPENVVDRAEFPTTSPAETLGKCCEWLQKQQYDCIGIACFGPVDLQINSPTYGYITTTPKPGWKNTDVVGPVRKVRPDVPLAFDTDVNAPALAEHLAMVAEAKARGDADLPTSCAYITVGTGVGVGLVVNSTPVHGLMHPEGGHVAVPRRAVDYSFEGSNPTDCFGGSCAENMCCSIALAKRCGLESTAELAKLGDDHEAWDAAAHYLGCLCANIVLLCSPERIVLSGGVMLRGTLFPKVRQQMEKMLNGYIQMPQVTTADGLKDYVAPSRWGNKAGLVGALTLAQRAKETPKASKVVAADSTQLVLLGVTIGALAAFTFLRVARS